MSQNESEISHCYRIKEVVEMTGISKKTIHFYLAEKLLPQPEKTAKNMAWYSEEHIRRLKMIKDLQEQHFLPLKAIKSILTEIPEDGFSPKQQKAIESVRQRFLFKKNALVSAANLPVLLQQLAVSPEELQEMESSGIITIDRAADPPALSAEDQKILGIWSRLRNMGFSPDRGFSPHDMVMYEEVVSLLFTQEFKNIVERMRDIREDEALVLFEDAIPLLNELIGILHEKKIHEFLKLIPV